MRPFVADETALTGVAVLLRLASVARGMARRTIRIHREDLGDDVDGVPATTDGAVLQSALGNSGNHFGSKEQEQENQGERDGNAEVAHGGGGRRSRRGARADLFAPASFGRVQASSREDCDELHVNFCRVGNYFLLVLSEAVWGRRRERQQPPSAPIAPSLPPILFPATLSRGLDLELFECEGLDGVAVAALAALVGSDAPLERLAVQHGFVLAQQETAGVEPLLEALATNTRLRELKIRAGHLPVRIGERAARAVGQSRTLASLTISGIDIPLEDMERLARYLRRNDRLESLDLASALTRVPSKAFLHLVASCNWRLETVHLQGIPDRDYDQIAGWTRVRNLRVRNSMAAWEELVRTGRVAAAAGAAAADPADPTGGCPMLMLLPLALQSLQSKPTLAFRLLREKHLDDLVMLWQQQRMQPAKAKAATTKITTASATTSRMAMPHKRRLTAQWPRRRRGSRTRTTAGIQVRGAASELDATRCDAAKHSSIRVLP